MNIVTGRAALGPWAGAFEPLDGTPSPPSEPNLPELLFMDPQVRAGWGPRGAVAAAAAAALPAPHCNARRAACRRASATSTSTTTAALPPGAPAWRAALPSWWRATRTASSPSCAGAAPLRVSEACLPAASAALPARARACLCLCAGARAQRPVGSAAGATPRTPHPPCTPQGALCRGGRHAEQARRPAQASRRAQGRGGHPVRRRRHQPAAQELLSATRGAAATQRAGCPSAVRLYVTQDCAADQQAADPL